MISAFCGIRYDADRVSDLSQVIAPPYDVISPAESEALYAQHPQNVVKLILAKEELANILVFVVGTRHAEPLHLICECMFPQPSKRCPGSLT